ncbi:MAG: hypothetical protein K0S55_1199, partial [Clostridia bacterium]|nr:hypothetical protein [Clostridia bacterium]
MEFLYIAFLFWMGGLIYQIIELLWSGKSHWSMFFVGGACVVLINLIYKLLIKEINIIIICLLGGAVITLIEFIVGFIVNIKLKWRIWDYSKMKNNIMGQVCLRYSFYWAL